MEIGPWFATGIRRKEPDEDLHLSPVGDEASTIGDDSHPQTKTVLIAEQRIEELEKELIEERKERMELVDALEAAMALIRMLGGGELILTKEKAEVAKKEVSKGVDRMKKDVGSDRIRKKEEQRRILSRLAEIEARAQERKEKRNADKEDAKERPNYCRCGLRISRKHPGVC